MENEEDYDFTPLEPAMNIQLPQSDDGTLTYQELMTQKQYEIKYQQDLKIYSEKLETYHNNRERVAGLLWNRCNRAMQSKIENRKDYEKIKGDPIELLKAIKQHALSFQETKWSIQTIIDALKAFVNIKQKEGEPLIDYLKRFKTARDVIVSHIGGPLILTKLVQDHKDYTTIESLRQETSVSYVCDRLEENQKIEKEV